MSRSIRIDEAVYRKLQTMAGTYNLGFCTPNDVLKRMLNGVEPWERGAAPRRWKKKLHVTLNPQHLEAMQRHGAAQKFADALKLTKKQQYQRDYYLKHKRRRRR